MPVSTQRAAAPPLVITAYNNGAPIPYTTPRTPWGDPDLQGVWSSDDTAGIPRERPANLGTRLYQTDEEWAARQKQVADGVRRGESAVGSFRNDYATRAFRQTSLIVDPPDGRQPAVTPEAEKRRAPRDRGTFGNGPFNTFEDFTLYDRCITRGIVGSVLRVVYGNGNRIVQGPGMVAFSYEMIHDTRIFYTDGRPHLSQNIRQYLGDSRARWEGDELVVVTTNLTDKTSIGGNGNGLRHSDTMVITERFKRVADDVDPVPVHGGRPGHLQVAVHDVDAAHAALGRRHPALRMPRGERRREELAQRRTRRGRGASPPTSPRAIVRPRRAAQEGATPGGGLPAAPRPAEENYRALALALGQRAGRGSRIEARGPGRGADSPALTRGLGNMEHT